MEQSRLGSLIEAAMNTAIGFVVSFVAWPLGAWLCGLPGYSSSQHAGIVGFFTVISVARSYIVRRWFNARLHRAAALMASSFGSAGK